MLEEARARKKMAEKSENIVECSASLNECKTGTRSRDRQGLLAVAAEDRLRAPGSRAIRRQGGWRLVVDDTGQLYVFGP